MASAALVMVALAGCTPSLGVISSVAQAEGAARVEIREVHGTTVTLVVYNLSPDALVIERDGVEVVSPTQGAREREPGGVSSIYTVAPGGAHEVKVRFDLAGWPSGEQVRLRFEPRFASSRGRAVHLAPLELQTY